MPKKSTYNPHTDGVNQSALSLWMTCREKARIKLVLGLAPQEKRRCFEEGNAYHRILEFVYDQIKVGSVKNSEDVLPMVEHAIADVEGGMEKDGNHQALDSIQSQLDMAYVLIPEYFHNYETDFGLEWLGVEQEFSYFNDDGIRVFGTMDGAFKARGKPFVLENKFYSRWSEYLSETLYMDLQLAMYMTAFKPTFGVEPVKCRFNIIRKPQIKPKKNEKRSDFGKRLRVDIRSRPEFYFERHDMPCDKDTLTSNKKRIDFLVKEFVAWWDAASRNKDDRDPLFNSFQCDGKYGVCECVKSCANGDFSYLGPACIGRKPCKIEAPKQARTGRKP